VDYANPWLITYLRFDLKGAWGKSEQTWVSNSTIQKFDIGGDKKSMIELEPRARLTQKNGNSKRESQWSEKK
jgi:hypothetical protein